MRKIGVIVAFAFLALILAGGALTAITASDPVRILNGIGLMLTFLVALAFVFAFNRALES